MARHIVYPMDHPLMENQFRLRGHARCALARAAASIESLRHQAISGGGLALRQQSALMHEVVRDLELRLHDLQARYVALASEGGTDPGAPWRGFFDCYDGFLEALRQCRSEIAMMQARQGQDDGAAAVDLPTSAGARRHVG